MKLLLVCLFWVLLLPLVPSRPAGESQAAQKAHDQNPLEQPGIVLGEENKVQGHPDDCDAKAASTDHATKVEPLEVESLRLTRRGLCVNAALAVVGVCGVGVAAWTAFLVLRQCKLLKRQIDASTQSSQMQLRAYVCIEAAALAFPEPGVPKAHLRYKNCGQTPAFDVRIWFHTWISSHPLIEQPPRPPKGFEMAANTMGPGVVNTIDTLTKPALQGQDLATLGTPANTLYVYGQVSYRDIFGKGRFTRFRLIYGGPEGRRGAPKKDGMGELWILSPDTDGNEAT